MIPIIDATSNSGVKSTVSSFSWNHTVAAQENRLLVVCLQGRHNADVTLLNSRSVTAGGVNMILANSLSLSDIDGGDSRSEIWFLPNCPTGTISIAVTLIGTCDHYGGEALSVYNFPNGYVDSAASGSQNTGSVDNPSVNITTNKNYDLVVDSVYGQDGTDYTIGADQTIISSQLGVNAGGDRAFSSYELASTSGSKTMSWTASATDKWVSAVAAFKTNGFLTIKGFSMVKGISTLKAN